MCEDCGMHGEDHDHEHPHEHSHDHEHDHSHEHSHSHEGEHSHDHEHAEEPPEMGASKDEAFRIAVTGKGGVGKTTLSAAIAQRLAAEHEVIAIDADPDMNLAGTLGVEAPAPITEQQDLIEERAGTGGGLIRLSPDVDDVFETHATRFGENGRLLTIGAPAGANTGCMCPENSFIRSFVSSALDEAFVVMDMEAGVEHLGRGTADSVDVLFVVVEPSQSSIETANRIRGLADEIGIDSVRAVLNKTRGNADVVAAALDIPVAFELPYDDGIASAGLRGESPVSSSEILREAAAKMVETSVDGDRIAAD